VRGVNKLSLTVLNDNEPGPRLLNAWGWSVLVSTESWRILFDAGPDPSILGYNASKLGEDLSSIDAVFLSHHHGDHSGGLEYVARVKPGAPVYAPPGRTGYIESLGLRPLVVEKPTRIAVDAWSTGPLKAWGLWEHSLVVLVEGLGAVVIVGCSHPGVDRLVEEASRITGAKVHMVIGGFHSPSTRSLDRLAGMASIICPAHCSGYHAKQYVASKYPGKYCSVRTGSIIELKAPSPAG